MQPTSPHHTSLIASSLAFLTFVIMPYSVLPFFFAALGIRLVSLFVSISHEKKLKAAGAVEYGKLNTLLLTIAHIFFYLACAYEAGKKVSVVNEYTCLGLGLFAVSMLFLYMVIRQLGPMWTVKLIIAPKQEINTSFWFKYVRHPNYFLNVLPELVAIALICQAWTVLVVGLPLYLIPLTIRIVQEEKIMRKQFADY